MSAACTAPQSTPTPSSPASASADLAAGSRLAIYWDGDDTWYPGTVTRRLSSTICEFLYDDGAQILEDLSAQPWRTEASSTPSPAPPARAKKPPPTDDPVTASVVTETATATPPPSRPPPPPSRPPPPSPLLAFSTAWLCAVAHERLALPGACFTQKRLACGSVASLKPPAPGGGCKRHADGYRVVTVVARRFFGAGVAGTRLVVTVRRDAGEVYEITLGEVSGTAADAVEQATCLLRTVKCFFYSLERQVEGDVEVSARVWEGGTGGEGVGEGMTMTRLGTFSVGGVCAKFTAYTARTESE